MRLLSLFLAMFLAACETKTTTVHSETTTTTVSHGSQKQNTAPHPDPSTTNLISWNIQNFGGSKDAKEVAFMAHILHEYDAVAIQEVATGPAGAQAVGRLGEALDGLGGHWEYSISDPTTSTGGGSERYAFIWNSDRIVKKGRAWLDANYAVQIDREPYCITFSPKGSTKEFTMVSFHAVPKGKQPESEIKYLRYLPAAYPKLHLLFCGDFNLAQSHNVFAPLKGMGYSPTLTRQKTTLRQECKDDDCLASEYDNFFCNPQQARPVQSGAILFHEEFASMREAHQISDHLPVYLRVEVQ